ncbi:hypothetical protein IQ283_02135 [Alkalihalobacillus hwajinpoensis]|uniref:hypothetical protein n=1 Tax=Guptibacillus hwajinpoensis TaxID=208199 RepID=UPI001883D448|nr:hypothetical protein [Pseudalkalibacillus hwajinpoensis]MBF0705389.1 hypothetical protein [Pseudalkalibacillus hwajinpoensis]
MNSNKPLVVELNGIPGSGKTSTVKELFHNLEKRGLKVLILRDVYFYKEKKTSSKLLVTLKAIFSFTLLKNNMLTIKFLLLFPFNLSRLLFALRLIKLNYQLLRVYESENCDIILLEEGLLQYTANIPHVDSFDNKTTLNKLLKNMTFPYKNMLLINCDLNLKESVKRIYNRGLKNRRFDVMEEQELLTGLKKNQEFFGYMREICKHKDSISLNMSCELNYNVDIVVNKISQKLS